MQGLGQVEVQRRIATVCAHGRWGSGHGGAVVIGRGRAWRHGPKVKLQAGCKRIQRRAVPQRCNRRHSGGHGRFCHQGLDPGRRQWGGPLAWRGLAPCAGGGGLRDGQQQQQVVVGRKVKRLHRLGPGAAEQELLQQAQHLGRGPRGFDVGQRVGVVVEHAPRAVEAGKLRHLRIEGLHELRTQLGKLVHAAERVVQLQKLQIGQRRGLAVLGNVVLQDLDGLLVLAHRNEEFRLLLDVKKLFGVDDVQRCRCRSG